MRLLAPCLVLALALQFTSAAISQVTTVQDTTQTPVFGIGHNYISDLNAVVNPANGSLSIMIAAPAPHERGINFPLYPYIYNSDGQYQLEPAFGYDPSYSEATVSYVQLDSATDGGGAGYTGGNPLTGAIDDGAPGTVTEQLVNLSKSAGSSGGNVTCTYDTDYVYTDASGGRHPLNLVWVPSSQAQFCGDFNVTSSSVTTGGDDLYHAYLDTSTGKVYVFNDAGVQLNNGQVQIEDTNGNLLNSTGRPYAGVYSEYLPEPTSITVPGLGSPYAIANNISQTGTKLPSPTLTLISASQPGDCATSLTNNSSSISGSTTITLPDKLTYVITFDPTYGLPQKITYPTGATVTYTWGMNSQAEGIGFQETGTASAVCVYHYDWPAIQKMVISFDGVHPAEEQDYQYSTVWGSGSLVAWSSKTTTVTTKDLLRPGTPTFQTIYTYLPGSSPAEQPFSKDNVVEGGPVPVENTITYYDTTGSLLRTVTKVWGDSEQLLADCTTLPSGQTSGVFYQYATWEGRPTLLPTDKAVYSYGSVTSGCQRPSSSTVPLQETETSYQSFSPTPIIPSVPSILNRPLSVKVYDQGTLVSETDYGYDQSPLVNVSAYNHDDTNYGTSLTGPRGNLTSVTRDCFDSSCTNAKTTYTYYITGQVASKTDPCGNASCSDVSGSSHTTQYSWTDNYTSDDGSPPGNTNAYLAKITQPSTTGGVTLETTYQYGYNDGRLRKSTDVNNSTSIIYCYTTGGCSGNSFDPWFRLTGIEYPDGGQKSATYNDAGPQPSTVVTTLVNGAATKANTTVLDGMGHVTQTQLQGSGYDVTIDLTRDGLGRLWEQSNPHFSSSSSTDGTTTFYYNALGEKVAQVLPDGNALSWCYNDVPPSLPSGMTAHCNSHLGTQATGPWVDFTDEKGNEWQRTRDALGRLTEVMEPNGSTQTPSMETDYEYPANQMEVYQWGASQGSSGDRPRMFIYNSLSELEDACNPEAIASRGSCGTSGPWSEAYVYDANGNVLARTDARGITTNYKYDVLNRLIQKSYSQGTSADPTNTPLSCYEYDASSSTFSGFTGSNLAGQLSNEWTQPSGTTCGTAPTSGGYITLDAFSYDPMGRVSTEDECTPANCTATTPYQMSYNYDLAGDMISSTNGLANTPGAPAQPLTFTYGWNGALWLNNVTSNWCDSTHPCPLMSVQTFMPTGAVSAMAYGSGLTLSRSYDNRLRITGEIDKGSVRNTATPGAATITITGTEQSQ